MGRRHPGLESERVCEQCDLPVSVFSAEAAQRVAGESVILTTLAPGRGPLHAPRALPVPLSVVSERPALWGAWDFSVPMTVPVWIHEP